MFSYEMATNFPNDLVGVQFNTKTELEVIQPSSNPNSLRIAATYTSFYFNGAWYAANFNAIAIIDYDFNLGVFQQKTIRVNDTFFGTDMNFVKGLEFSASGDYLYFTAKPQNNPNRPRVYRFDYNNNTTTALAPTIIPNLADELLENSMIELGKDGLLYFNWYGDFYSLSNSDNQILTQGDFVFSNLATPNGMPYCYQNVVPSNENEVFSLPDQIDGENYNNLVGNLPLVISSTSQFACNGSTITLDAGPGFSSYLWSTGATSQTINVTNGGVYTVTVTYSCVNTTSATIDVSFSNLNAPVVQSISSTPNNCYGASLGTADVTASGNQPLSYLWSNGFSGTTLSNLPAGIYTVIVSDSQGCTTSATTTVSQPPIYGGNLTGTSTLCSGSPNSGTITANIFGGTPPYSYQWSNGQITSTITNLSAGTYNLTVIDNNGCVLDRSFTINASNLSVVINPSPTGTICSPTAGLLLTTTVNTNNVSYLWNTGATTSSITAFSPGNYTVTVTTSNGCTETATTQLNASSTFGAIISGPTDLCSTSNQIETYLVNLPNPSNFTFVWSQVGGITINATGNQFSVTWNAYNTITPGGGTIFVTIIDNITGCVDSKKLDVYGCCNITGLTTFTNATLSNNSYIGQSIVMNGEITITGNVNFNSCNVYMGGNAKIVLRNGASLTIDRTHIIGCSDMWQGIFLDDASQYLEINNYSSIEDAYTAVNARKNSVLNIQKSTFNKNQIHIWGLELYNQFTCTANTFDCDNGGILNCLLPPIANTHTTNSIKLEECNLQIGNPGTGNIFRNSDIAVNAKTGNFNFSGNTIESALKYGLYIYSDSYLEAHQNVIDNVKGGIVCTDKVRSFISSNKFNNIKQGVYIFKNLGNATILDNQFKNVGYMGIQIGLTYNNSFEIARNKFTNTSLPNLACAIYIGQASMDRKANYKIYNNEVYEFTYGIQAVQLYKPQIYSNLISIQPRNNDGTSPFGIKTDICENPLIQDNNVSSAAGMNNAFWIRGIATDNSSETNMQCNTIANVGAGLWFGGSTPNSTVGGNEMGDCYWQLFLNYNAMGLGDIGCDVNTCAPDGITLDNLWIGNNIGGNTYAFNSNDPIVGGYTTFHVKQGNPTEPLNNFVNPQSNPCQTTYTNPYIVTLPYCDRILNEKERSSTQYKIASNEFNLDPAEKWYAKQYLYNSTKVDLSLMYSDAVFIQQSDSLYNTILGKLENIKEDVSFAASDDLEVSEISNLLNQVNSLQTNNAIELYSKLSNRVSLQYQKSQAINFTNNQTSVLRTMSALCPYVYGPSVYTSQMLLTLTDTVFPIYANCTINSNSANRIGNKESVELKVSVSPNPSKGEFVFILSNSLEQGNLIIKNSLNQIVYTSTIQGETININLDVDPGLYFYEINTSKGSIVTNKLMITN
jgi:hypothetical protein